MLEYAYKYRSYLPPDSESHWASADEICENTDEVDLTQAEYPACGIPLCRDGDRVFVNNGDDHTLIFGSTGSKKTRACVLPLVNMALHAGESVVCTDPKGELYARTAEAAKEMGYQVLVLNLRDFTSGEGYNPISPIYDAYHGGQKDEAMEMINDFVESISASQKNARGVDPFWWQTAASFAVANLLFLMRVADRRTANISSFALLCLEDTFEKLETLSGMMSPGTIAGMNYRCIFGEPERTRKSTQASLTAMVQQFFCNKRLQKMMSETTFDLSSCGRQKTAIYIILSDEKSTYYFMVTTFLKQLYEALIKTAQSMPDLRLPVRVNFVLDEFGNIPEIPGFCNAIAAARSRNIRYFLIVQSMLQLEHRYGSSGASIVKANCNDWVFMNSKELPLLQEISQLCGTRNTPAGQQPLISVPALQRLKKEMGYVEAVVLSGRNYPYMAQLPDIDSYEMFRTEAFAEMPPRKFNDFVLLDFDRIYSDIRAGLSRCPFRDPIEDDTEDATLLKPLKDEARDLLNKFYGYACTPTTVDEAKALLTKVKRSDIREACKDDPAAEKLFDELERKVRHAEKYGAPLKSVHGDVVAERDECVDYGEEEDSSGGIDALQAELERKFDELFGSLLNDDDEEDNT